MWLDRGELDKVIARSEAETGWREGEAPRRDDDHRRRRRRSSFARFIRLTGLERTVARPGLHAALAALAGFLALAAAAGAGCTAALDRMTLETFDALRGPHLDGFFRVATWLGSGYVLAPATIAAMAALVVRRQWSAARLVGLAYFGASISTWLLKRVIGRERPAIFPALAEIAPGDWSFPSGHATHAAAAALGLGLVALRHGVQWRAPVMALLAAAALVVVLSRLYLQVHWPSDLLAGVLVAGFWAGLAAAVSPQSASGPA